MATPDHRIDVPWKNRVRYLVTQQLQTWVFLATVGSVFYLWFTQKTSVRLTGQVEIVRLTVPASRSGLLTADDTALQVLDRVERGVTTIAEFDVTDALLKMQTLTVERQKLLAELEAERQSITQQQEDRKLEQQRFKLQSDQKDFDRVRSLLDAKSRVDQLVSDFADAEQQRRSLVIRRAENQSKIQTLESNAASLTEQRSRAERLLELKIISQSRIDDLDREISVNQAQLETTRQLHKMLANESKQVEKTCQEVSRRLSDARANYSRVSSETSSETTAPPPSDSDPLYLASSIDTDVRLEPFVQALAVHDAMIQRLANEIATNQIIAPASGRIAEIHQPPGTYVRTGDPIATIATDQKRWIIAYLDRPNQISLNDETVVTLSVKGNREIVAQTWISQLADHFESVPPRLRRHAETEQWGVPIKFAVPEGIDLVPGQLVDLDVQ